MAKPKQSNASEMATFLDRILKLEEEKQAVADDIKELWAEAKGQGFDMKALRKTHSIRKMKVEDRRVLRTYTEALGLFD